MNTGTVKQRYSILVADDISENIDLMEAYLASLDVDLITATNGQEALELCIQHNPDLILLDVMMPGMTGIQVCEKLREREGFRFTPIVMVTSLSEVTDKVSAIESGATDFLTKPVNRIELITRVKALLSHKRLYEDLVHSYDLIIALVQAVEARDPYTKGHSERVGNICASFGSFLGLEDLQIEQVHRAGLLHDIGKIGISDSILNKPDRLTADEYITILDHPVIGANIIGNVKSLRDVVPLIRHHHERYDGKGHPDGLSGEEIPLGARIISIVDTYDAVVSRRIYSSERTERDAIGIFQAEKENGQWDPFLVGRFLDYLISKNNGNLPSVQIPGFAGIA